MPVTRKQLIVILALTGFYWAGLLLTGTNAVVSSLFAVAILFGTLSVLAGGGLGSAFGCLNAILIGKFLSSGSRSRYCFWNQRMAPLKPLPLLRRSWPSVLSVYFLARRYSRTYAVRNPGR